MDQLQSKLYQLLVEIDDICKRNNITYYLAGGTALGSIRNGGFLPWDDDIDLYITRENWDRLVKVMETETPEDRLFVCIENTDLYWNPVGRYVDKTSTVMMKAQLLCGKACGQLIEFFVMDPMPRDKKKMWEHRQYVKAYTELLTPYFVVGRGILTDNLDYDVDLYNKYYRKSLIFGKEKVLKQLLDKITSVEEKDSDYYCMRWGLRTLIYGKDLLAEPRMEKFEEGMFPVPAKQEEVARIAYGDSWMYVPEGSGKVVHDLDKDLGTPFKKYVDLYMPLLDKDALLKGFKKNKRERAKALYNKCSFKKEFAIARAEVAAKHIEKEGYDIEYLTKLLNSGRYDELETQISYFLSQQFHPEIKANKIVIPVPDEYLFLAIMLRVLQGKYYNIVALLNNRMDKPEPLSDDLKDCKKIMEFCQSLSIAIYDQKDLEQVKTLLRDNEKYNNIIDFARAKLWCMTKDATSQKEFEAIVEYAHCLEKQFGNDGEIVRFEANALSCLGKLEESKEKYNYAIKHTRNGFVWKEAQEKFGLDAYNIVDNAEDSDDEDEEDYADEE